MVFARLCSIPGPSRGPLAGELSRQAGIGFLMPDMVKADLHGQTPTVLGNHTSTGRLQDTPPPL